jgi:hypothetical protein
VPIKKSLFAELMGQIANRKKLTYGLAEEIKGKMYALCCCASRKPFALKQKEELYEKAMKKIDEELDIRHITQELRTLRFISDVILTKY